MTFNSIDNLLTILLSQPQWQKPKRFYEVKKSWYEIVNHKVAQHTRPITINNQILYIATANAAWAQEMSLQKLNLLRKLNGRLETPLENLHFASAQWHNQTELDLTDHENEPHPSLITLLPPYTPLERKETPQAALQQWWEKIQTRSSDWQPCPRCQTLAPLGELKRWQVCMMCFRHQQESNS